MNRYRAPALLATAVLVFAACSSSGGATQAPVVTSAPSAAATTAPTKDPNAERIKLGFVTHVIGNPFIQQIIDGANAAAKDLNVDLQVTGPEGGDADAQL